MRDTLDGLKNVAISTGASTTITNQHDISAVMYTAVIAGLFQLALKALEIYAKRKSA